MESYQYDDLWRLQSISRSGALAEYLVHDATGSLSKYCQGAGLKGVFDGQKRLSDCQGALSIGYGYDGSNRLSRVIQAGQLDWSAYYSPSGQRILTIGNGQTQYFFYNGDNLYSEARSSAPGTRPDARYIHAGLDAPVAGFWDTGVLYYHAGAQGSIGLTTGETGQAVNRSGYTAFGEAQGLSGGAPYRYGYTGRETDITGLMYYRNRYYVPRIGRFTQPDPAGFIDGPNRYLYVGNNPVTFIDPWGLEAQNPSVPRGSSHGQLDVIEDISAVGGLSHYLAGSGSQLNISFSNIANEGVSVADFPYIQYIGNTYREGGGVEGVVVPVDTFMNVKPGGFDNALMIGNFRLNLNGSFVVNNGYFVFDGRMSAVDNEYDFDPAEGSVCGTYRGCLAEFSTRLGSLFLGEGYTMHFVGEQVVHYEGRF